MAWNPSPLHSGPVYAACMACLSPPELSDLGLAHCPPAAACVRPLAERAEPTQVMHRPPTLSLPWSPESCLAQRRSGPPPPCRTHGLLQHQLPVHPEACFIYVADLPLPLNATISHRTLLHTHTLHRPSSASIATREENDTQHLHGLHSFFDFHFDFGQQLSFPLAPAAPPLSLSSLRSPNLSPVSLFSLESTLENPPD